jgi:peroxiredoxin
VEVTCADEATLLGISVDGVWCHSAFAETRHLHFPLLADFEPKGAVARQYGVYREADGITDRALFVIDGDGVIRWSYVSPFGVNPGADGILAALESLVSEPTSPTAGDGSDHRHSGGAARASFSEAHGQPASAKEAKPS